MRYSSIDFLRAITMLFMIWVNDFWSLINIPKWLKHTREMIPWTKMPSHWGKKGEELVVKNKYKELKTIGSIDAQVDSIKNYLISYNIAEYDDSLALGEGEEEEEKTKLEIFKGYQINADLLKMAAENAHVMHCLPAHRGLEITEEVIEGPRSIVWQQAENKMYGAAGILDHFVS